MRNRERFNAYVDETEEQKLSIRITAFRRIIKKLSSNLHDTCAGIEPCDVQLIWGSLCRCLICIESGVTLVSQGYIGSANALLRQIMEFLMWAKLGLSSDEELLKKINGFFYDYSLGKSHPVTNILKKTTIQDYDNKHTGVVLAQECKELYHRYSFLTHATGIAQQNPYRNIYYYELLNRCLTELCMLTDVFLIVFKQYCNKVMAVYDEASKKTNYDVFNLDDNNEEEREFGHLWAAATYSGTIVYQIIKYHKILSESQGEFFSDLQMAFSSKWHINL